MLFGAGKAVITPPVGTFLAGFGFRTKGSEFVRDPLEVRSFWMDGEDGGGPMCIVAADLIGFDEALDSAVRADLVGAEGLCPERILIAASHTHSGPQTCSRLPTAGGRPDEAYLESLRARIRQSVGQARADARPAVVRLSRGTLTGYAVNRRLRLGAETVMAANPAGPRDDEVTVVSFRTPDGAETPLGLLFHFACHPTTLKDYGIGPDYPGAARRHLEKTLSGVPCAFLNGCCGDVRPACIRIGGVQFRAGEPEEAEEFGVALAEEALRALRGPQDAVEPRLAARLTRLSLPLADGVTRVPLAVQRFDLGDTLSLAAMGAEPCAGYGRFVKRLDPSRALVPVGYANGLAAYIPMEHMLAEGGYEPASAAAVYGYPAAFAPGIERLVKEGIASLFGGAQPARGTEGSVPAARRHGPRDEAVPDPRRAAGNACMKGLDPSLLACPKTDVHTHIGIGVEPAEPARIEEYIEGSRKLGIGPSWISRPFLGVGREVPGPEVLTEANRLVAEAVRSYPQDLRGYLFVHAGRLAWSVEEMNRWLSEPGMVGVKLYHQYFFDDPAVITLVREAVRRNAVVLLHQGKAVDEATRRSQPLLSDGTHIARLAEAVPDAVLLAGHIGGGGDWEWMAKALRDAPSVRLDTSGSVFDAGMIEYAVSQVGVERLLFATDMSIEEGVGKILAARIGDAEKRAIFHGNAEAMLREVGR